VPFSTELWLPTAVRHRPHIRNGIDLVLFQKRDGLLGLVRRVADREDGRFSEHKDNLATPDDID